MDRVGGGEVEDLLEELARRVVRGGLRWGPVVRELRRLVWMRGMRELGGVTRASLDLGVSRSSLSRLKRGEVDPKREMDGRVRR